jgi:hypothetical protein
MNTRKMLIGLAAMTLGVIGPAATTADAARPERPMKATTMSPFEFTGACTNGVSPGLLATITGTGRATHLGVVATDGSTCVTFTGVDTGLANGAVTLTGANGDVLYTTMSGVFGPANPDGSLPVHYVMQIRGGTGRFDDANGTMESDGVLVATGPASGYHAATWVGTISY